MPQEEDMIRPAGAARLAGVSEATVRRWVREKRLVKYTDGLGRLWVDGAEVRKLVTPVPVTGAGS
jgi:predicted site-specific integrase-resolvase